MRPLQGQAEGGCMVPAAALSSSVEGASLQTRWEAEGPGQSALLPAPLWAQPPPRAGALSWVTLDGGGASVQEASLSPPSQSCLLSLLLSLLCFMTACHTLRSKAGGDSVP